MPHLEIERKYLIRMPDSMFLSGGRTDRIIQTYLLPAPGFPSRRVRMRRSPDGSVVYTYTCKGIADGISRTEEEKTIAEEEYAALLRQADPACNPVEKQRTVLPYRGRILEIDVYPFWKHTAVLEIELKTPDEIPEIPPQIIVLADVSQERRYSNHAMARHIPQEPV